VNAGPDSHAGARPVRMTRALRVALRSYGAKALRLRAKYEVRRRFGLYQAAPRVPHVVDVPSNAPSPFDVDLDRVRLAVNQSLAVERADRVASGMHQAYRDEWLPRPRSGAEWNVHPLLGTQYPSEPWWEMRRFLSLDPTRGDVKDVWEPGRFTWVFDLVLGYAVTRDERYAEAFWNGAETFVEGNPPFRGIQWNCGQETSIRALSCLWGERAFAHASASTPQRRALLVDLFAWSGERVADAIEYAISQRNNHGISEAVGLVALGARLSGVHPHASQWLHHGTRLLNALVLDQFADDGWYIQHSLTYLRLALDQCIVAQRVLRHARGRGFSETAKIGIRAAIALLVELHDPTTGDVPNHGANDGSLVLPVSTSGYRDFRPSITAGAGTFAMTLPHGFQISQEAVAWLSLGHIPRHVDPPSARVVSGPSGWVSARRGRTRVFIRAGEYHSNPSHIDPGHVDIWIDGEPRAVDAGTFRYTAPAPWANGLSTNAVHNTVEVPSMPAARKSTRFLWLRWPAADVIRIDESVEATTLDIWNGTWEARGLSHGRRCVLNDDSVDVFDDIDSGHNAVEVHVHWLLPDGASLPTIESTNGGTVSLVRASETSVEGWRSLHDAERHAAMSVTFVTTVSGRATVHSRFMATNLPRESLTGLPQGVVRA
jgi:hypothetical protein